MAHKERIAKENKKARAQHTFKRQESEREPAGVKKSVFLSHTQKIFTKGCRKRKRIVTSPPAGGSLRCTGKRLNRTDADSNHREVVTSAIIARRPQSLQTDQTQLDMKIIASDGRVLRPWLIVEVDAYSRLVLRTLLRTKDIYAG